jgi:phosphoribosylaminoimidazole-succinocarboxamide synthase
VQHVTLALFARGQQVAADAGLILADTKYELGLADDGTLLIIDELHTPDSSRYWIDATYAARLTAGEEPESLDKELVRRALIAAGYGGDGEPPALHPDVWATTSTRYVEAYERITGRAFVPGSYPVEQRITEVLAHVH